MQEQTQASTAALQTQHTSNPEELNHPMMLTTTDDTEDEILSGDEDDDYSTGAKLLITHMKDHWQYSVSLFLSLNLNLSGSRPTENHLQILHKEDEAVHRSQVTEFSQLFILQNDIICI
ncbi:hypothetical protein PAAG_02918 [Paracoccidioides lutzii Pb01]|uniref:Uncharacterized protein n=1 Tax=Paracoccidioides lutzii (strain ATCC MYA-826 / Pb01) TaxID=502779 RepID=C1GWM3_PARBA|nr:hypothetical protein PAAG_02918 [Paracoccidioides lutzii Pb01]EEH40942.2 hypothetical protein PAAG_02918 [Paracoccidioides lutzii Pb01]